MKGITKMHLILLSGGSGKRLWPLSNDIRSKQFIKLFRRPDGVFESMVQRIYRQIRCADPEATVTIATSKSQVSAIKNQLGEDVTVCVEPCRRDTFPAIALAAMFLHDVKCVGEEEPVVVCPVDPYVDEDYFRALTMLGSMAAKGGANLSLMGIEPTYPSEKYGYIIPQSSGSVSKVKAFKEKPAREVAAQYIAQGALWNGGIFAFRLGYLLKKARERMDITDYDDLYAHYDRAEKISFDYAVAESEPSIQVLRFGGRWIDLGTWNSLTEMMDEPIIGKAQMDETCENVKVINEMNVPILCMGLRDVVVTASPEGILVADKTRSSHIKPFVDRIDQQVMYAEKSWGSYRVVDAGENCLTVKLEMIPGRRMHYHSHQHREETWTVVSGTGIAIIDDVEIAVHPGTMLRMPAGSRHSLIAHTELTVIEVQMGQAISASDKRKHLLAERVGESRA